MNRVFFTIIVERLILTIVIDMIRYTLINSDRKSCTGIVINLTSKNIGSFFM